jgi:DNA-binding transcriptional ArsR family regulator
MERFLLVMSALADKTRLRLLLSLRERELCVCKLVEFVDMADSTVSRHMSILKAAGLVEARKSGRWVHYRMAEGLKGTLQKEILEVVLRQLSNDPELLNDAARLRELIQREGANICQEDADSCSVAAINKNRKNTELEYQVK